MVSSLHSKHICEHGGYSQLGAIKYEKFLDKDGEPVFKDTQPHQEVAAFVKRLEAED